MGNTPLQLDDGAIYTITVCRTDRAPQSAATGPQPTAEAIVPQPTTATVAPAAKPAVVPADPPLSAFWQEELLSNLAVEDEDEDSGNGDLVLEEYKLGEAKLSPGYKPLTRPGSARYRAVNHF